MMSNKIVTKFGGSSLADAGQFEKVKAILLLDEITANLDGDTEQAVLTALERAAARRTVVSISHRLYRRTGGRQIPI